MQNSKVKMHLLLKLMSRLIDLSSIPLSLQYEAKGGNRPNVLKCLEFLLPKLHHNYFVFK